MYEHVLAWAGLAVLAILCLPFSGTRKLVLELSALTLRLALLALLAGGAYLYFYPATLPAEATSLVNEFPRLRSALPEPGTPLFGLAAACVVTAVLLPCLAMLDVTRKLSGSRLSRLRALTAAPRAEPEAAPAAAPAPAAQPGRPAPTPHAPRRVDRRTAADTMAEAGSRKPFRVADHMSS